MALALFVLCCLAGDRFTLSAQQDERVQFASFIVQAYKAYERKDRDALLAIFSPDSPFLPQFKQFLDEELSVNDKVKFELRRVLILSAKVDGDEAKLRVLANMAGTDMQTGTPAERMPEWDHTLILKKENDSWKLWRADDTAAELASAFLTLKDESERNSLVKTTAPPITVGLLLGLQEQGRSLLEDKGEIDQAIEILNLTVRLAEEAKNVEGGAGALVGLGDAYAVRGDYGRAAHNYQYVLTLAESLGSKEGVAAVAVKMGNLHTQQGNLAQAMDYYQSSVKAYEELGSKVEIAYPLAMMGNAYYLQGSYEQALELCKRSLKIYRAVFSKSGEAWLLHKLGEVQAAQGNNQEAINNYEQSLKLQEELGNKLMTAQSLNGLAEVCSRQSNHKGAAELANRAISVARTTHAPEILWKALTSRGRAQLALGENGGARDSFAEAIGIVERLRAQVVGNEREQQLFFESKSAPYLGMVQLSLAESKPAEAFAYSERAKGRMLLDVLRSGKADIRKSMTAAEGRQEEALAAEEVAISTKLRRASLASHSNEADRAVLEQRLQKARLAYEAFETRLYAAHAELKIDRGEADPISLREAGSLLQDSRSVLLEYVITQEKVHLFVVTQNESDTETDRLNLKVYPIAISASELGKRVADFRGKIAENSLDFKELARQLYDLLLRPAQGELTGKTLVGVVPANQLWELPFQALMPTSNQFFLEEHALFYVPSLSVLREIRKRETSRTPNQTNVNEAQSGLIKTVPNYAAPMLLAFGNPAVSDGIRTRARSSMRDIPLTDLPEAEREVRLLGDIYGRESSKILIGKAAQEEAFKVEGEKYPIIHFATHGVLDNINPLYSRLVLSSSTDTEDGFLEAREIMKLNLRAKLAVLSACQTALGRVGEGEGLIGMSWAFFIAGTSTTVASQWKVDSASTSRLMIDFHRMLQGQKSAAGSNKAEMLRQASLKLMSDAKYKHPFYWAGFVVVGDGR